jgi:hypothetical protein
MLQSVATFVDAQDERECEILSALCAISRQLANRLERAFNPQLPS